MHMSYLSNNRIGTVSNKLRWGGLQRLNRAILAVVVSQKHFLLILSK